MARDRRPDLIVLDLSLPYRDGVDVAARATERTTDTVDAPIVVVSGSALQLTPDDRALVTDTVAKPFDIDRLMNVFRRHLGDRRSRRARARCTARRTATCIAGSCTAT